MNRSKMTVAIYLLIGIILAACSPSQAELDAQATQVAEAIFATQTAMVPKPTSTPTVTTTPSPLPPTPTPTSTPKPFTTTDIFDLVSPVVAFIDTPVGTGSGVLTEGGYIITNAHVVWPYQTVRVVFPDGSEFTDAAVLAWDLVGDLAVIGPLETSLSPIALTSNEEPIVGNDAYLIGYPAEVEDFPQPTITRGVISRLREWKPTEMTYLQVDAKIAGGQSGGVLVSAKGEVIGISGYYFSEAKFGLVASAIDVLPRVKKLIAHEGIIGFTDRKIGMGQGQLENTFTMRDGWDVQTYIIKEPVDTTVDIKLEGENEAGFGIFDVFGNTVAISDKGDEKVKTGSLTLELEAPYFVQVFQYSEKPGDFHISSSHKLISFTDPDDYRKIASDETLLGNIDTPDDYDSFKLDLDKEEVVNITVNSTLINPDVLVYFQGARENDMVVSHNDGESIFGSTTLTYKAPHSGSYSVIVKDAQHKGIGGYFLNIAPAPADAKPTAPQLADTIPSAFGPMEQYESTEHSFAIQRPAQWSKPVEETASCQYATACFIGSNSEFLLIVEEDFEALGYGTMSLEEYVEAMLSIMEAQVPNFEMVSRKQISTLQGLPAEVIVFGFKGGLFKASRITYVQDDSVAFNATYLTGKERHSQLEALIDYSFDTFRVWQSGQETEDPIFHLDKGSQLLAADDPEAAVEALTQAIELKPDLVEAYRKRASAYRELDELDKALADSDKLIELKPDEPELYQVRAYIYWLLPDYANAIKNMDQAIELDPQYDDGYNMRALMQATQGNYEAALADVNAAIDLRPTENADLLDTRGYIYLKIGEYEKAKADYEEIFNQGLEFPYALLGSGVAYAALDDAENAVEMLEAGLARVESIEHPDPQLADLISLAQETLSNLESDKE